MTYPARTLLLLLMLSIVALPVPARAQDATGSPDRSAKKALALSLLVPGLGHRYVHSGDWDGAASAFALADAGLWLGLLGSEVRRGQLVSDYETLAASRAGAVVEGKNRQFFLHLAAFRSSDEYLEVQLRNRNWRDIDYVADRTNRWRWESEADFFQFREMREDAETLRRRRTFLVGVLVANRLISGFTAIRAANRVNDAAPDVSLSLGVPPSDGRAPLVNLHVRF